MPTFFRLEKVNPDLELSPNLAANIQKTHRGMDTEGMKRLLALIALSLGFTTAQTTPAAPTTSLLGSQWELRLIGTKTVTAERKPTLNFAEGRAGGYLGCNTGGGAYILSNTSLQFGPIVSTMMACEDPLMKLERDYATALQKTLRFSLSPDGQTLRLVGTGKVLTFKRL